MTLNDFLCKFHLFADAPSAVPKLRELVLHLAFAQQLLPSTRPWPRKPLKTLTTKIGSGATPAGGKESYLAQGIPLIRSMNVHFSGFQRKGLVFLSDAQALELENVVVQPADVLLNITGASIGRVTTAPAEMANARVNQHVAIIRPTQELDAGFLAKFLASPAVQKMIDDVQIGATREALTKRVIEQFQIPVPPLAEQKQVAAKVNELMRVCDRLEALQQEREIRHVELTSASMIRFSEAPTPANLEFLFHKSYGMPPAELRETILTLAVQGNLVAQDPNDECAARLLDRIALERSAAVRAGLVHWMKHISPVEEDELGFTVRPGWTTARLIELVMEIQTGPFGSSLHKSDYHAGGTPVINPASLRDGAIVPISEMAVDASTLDRLKTFKLKTGDVVIARRGEMGRCALVTEEANGWLCGTGSLILRMPTSVHAPYLALLIGAPMARNYLRSASVGATMQNLNQSILARMPVAVPPLAEQRRIVEKVGDLMALVDTLETQLITARNAGAEMVEAVVATLTDQCDLVRDGMPIREISVGPPRGSNEIAANI